MRNKFVYGLLGVLGLSSTVASAAVDAGFTSAATSLTDSLGEYVTAILPMLGEALVVVFAFVALWAVYKVIRRVLSSAS